MEVTDAFCVITCEQLATLPPIMITRKSNINGSPLMPPLEIQSNITMLLSVRELFPNHHCLAVLVNSIPYLLVYTTHGWHRVYCIYLITEWVVIIGHVKSEDSIRLSLDDFELTEKIQKAVGKPGSYIWRMLLRVFSKPWWTFTGKWL